MERTKSKRSTPQTDTTQEVSFQRMKPPKKQSGDLIQQTRDAIDEKFKKNPIIFPNKTLLKWIEVYCPNCFTEIAGKMEKRHLFAPYKDIYHQNFKLILNEVVKFLKRKGYSDHYEWLSREMQNDLLEIEQMYSAIRD